MLNQFNSYRNENGYIVLDKIKDKNIINKPVFGSRKKYWMNLNDTIVLFKVNQKDGEDIKEMINQEISNYLGIPSASYDLAIMDGKKGVITLPFITGNDLFLPVLLLMFQSKSVGNSNDILSVYKALCENDATNDELSNIMRMYFANQVQDIFTFQYERNIENSGIILGNKEFLPGIRFDSSGSFLKFYDGIKINKFLLRSDRKEYVYKRGWGRTKLKITPTKISNSLDEFIIFRYDEKMKNSLPIIMQSSIEYADSMVEKMYNYNFKDTLHKLSDYNISISNTYQKLVNFCLSLSKERYEDGITQIKSQGFIKR